MTDTTVSPTAHDRVRAGLADRDRRELALWLGLLAVAIVVRFVDLGGRAFHHDESQDAYFSYLFSENPESYSYNPLLHGPFRFFLTGAFYWLFGDSNFTARLAPALMGVIAVGLPYLLRHRIGRVGAFGAAIILALGPTFLYFSRFAREDIYLAAITLGMIVGAFRFIERPRALTLSVVFGLAALAFATKESGLVLAGFIALFFMLAVAVQGVLERRRGGAFDEGEVARACRAVGWSGWVYAVATLLVVYGALFTVFFTDSTCFERNPDGSQGGETSCVNAVFFGIDYWREQQDVARGGDSAMLYPAMLIGHELPVLLLALAGLVATLRRPSTFRLFVVFFFAGALGFHMWGSERFAWLVLHPLLPLILLAGIGLQALWERRSRAGRIAAAVAVVVGAAYMAMSTWRANVELGTDPRSMLVSTQSSQQVKDVADQVLALNREWRRTHDQDLTISVDSTAGATFPYAWYFRQIDNPAPGYPELAATTQPPTSQVLILTDEAQQQMLPNLAAYEGRQFDFRVWWIKREPTPAGDGPYSADVGDWIDYVFTREPWTPTGGMKEWLYVRRDAGDLPGRGTESEIPAPPPLEVTPSGPGN